MAGIGISVTSVPPASLTLAIARSISSTRMSTTTPSGASAHRVSVPSALGLGSAPVVIVQYLDRSPFQDVPAEHLLLESCGSVAIVDRDLEMHHSACHGLSIGA